MARPSKRPAESDLDEDEDLIPTPSAAIDSTPPSGSVGANIPTPRPRLHEQRKRLRTSFDGEDDGSRQTTPPSDYESDNEEEEMAATQAIREKRAEHRENEPAECGILIQVEVHNFMCHEKMQFELGPLINFICGKNGSGKSAILTAIVLCLGGKAAATNRGQSLKNFIKEGKDNARIICTLKNEGEGAYMPEEYGDRIEIERHFSRAGTSGYKLRSEKGRIVSTKKMDLEEICDHFALQIDNPLNVLSQDQARQFIGSANASDKYRFFVKGVQLEQLDQDYRIIEDQLENIEASIENKRPDIKILEQKMQRAKAKDDAMKKKDGLRNKLRDLRRQIAWIQVRQQEEIRDQYIQEIEEMDQAIEESEQKVTELDDVFQATDQANEEAKVALDHAKEAVQASETEKTEKKHKTDEVKSEVHESQAELRNIQGSLKEAKNEVAKKERDIQAEEQRLIDINGGGAAERLRNLATAKQAADEAKSALQEHQEQRAGLDNKVLDLQAELENQTAERDAHQKTVDQREENLQQLLRNRDKLDSAYPRTLGALKTAIANETRFQQKPLGPLGKHVRLLKPEWSSVVEKSFGSTLNSFLVTSKHDANLLSDVMRRVRCEMPVVIGNNMTIDTSRNEPDPRFLTVLRALEIDNAMVVKQLVIAHGIEQTILISDLDEGSQVMFEQERHDNVKRCLCLQKNNKRRGFVLFYSRNGDPSQDPIGEYVGTARMQTDLETQIQSRRDALQEAKDQLQQASQEFFRIRNEFVRAQQRVAQHQKQISQLKLALQQADDDVDRLNDAIKDDNVESGGLEALRQLLLRAQDTIAIHEASFMTAVNVSDGRKRRLQEATRELNEIDDRISGLKTEQDRALARAQKTDKKRAYDLQAKNEAVERVNDARKDRETMNNNLEEKELKLQDFITQASSISERVNVPENESQESLENQYRSIRVDLERHQQQIGGTAEEIARQAKAAYDAYKKGVKDLRDLERLSDKLKSSLIERRERWKKFRSHISVRAKAQFTYLLSERSFRGRLVTDHKQKLLELSVEPDITKKDGSGRSARTLSGGEKSFSQICLLLSIWEAMGSPIRCLDEFDVFMDAVNRNLSVGLLVEAARQSIGRQFILISPGTKNDIQKAPDINVKEIDAPERGQKRLEFPAMAQAVAT